MAHHDFVPYWEQCVSEVDILEIYRQTGSKLNRNNRGKCVRCGSETLYLNRDWHSFRCLNLLCNDHGDVVSLIQRTAELSFPYAFAILDSGRCRKWWSIAELEQFGAVRDCMAAAAIFCASHFSRVEPYVNQRGIPTMLARQFLVGAGWGTDLLKNHLLESGFSLEIVRLTGLLNEDGQNRFQEHVVVPLRQYGQVFDFYGRYVGDNPAIEKDSFLPEERLVAGRGYFNWHTDREHMICTQGILDALSLFHNGFRNVVATGTDDVLDPMRLRGTKMKRVWLCVSTDEAARQRLLGTAYALADAGIETRIIEIPDGLGLNDFFLRHSAGDFTSLVVTAKTLEQWRTDHSQQ